MAKPKIQIIAIIDTLAHANTIKNNIVTELFGKDIFETHSLSVIKNEFGQFEVTCFVRFNSNIDRDTVKDWIKDQIENHPQVKNWVQKAKISWHTCTHDEVKQSSCAASDYFEWIKP